MPALIGRRVTFTPTGSGTPVTGMRTKTINFENEAVDITSDDDSGWQTFLAEDPAQRGVNLDVEGVTKDANLINLAMAGGGSLISEYTLEIEGIGAIVGDFHIGNLSLGAPYNEAVTFTCNIKSSGEPTWTPA